MEPQYPTYVSVHIEFVLSLSLSFSITISSRSAVKGHLAPSPYDYNYIYYIQEWGPPSALCPIFSEELSTIPQINIDPAQKGKE